MHKSKSLFNCSGAGTGEPGAVKAASPGSGRDGQKRSGSNTNPCLRVIIDNESNYGGGRLHLTG